MEVLKIDISYDSKAVEKHFIDFEKMKKKIGVDKTRIVKQRFTELKAADCFKETLMLRLGKPHTLEGDYKGCYGIHITGNYRIVIKPIIEEKTTTALHACNKIIVKGVVDYHGANYTWLIP